MLGPIVKKVLCFFILFSILSSFSKEAVLFFTYQLYQNTIEQRFCINKNQPQKHCRGRCHLKTALKEENKKSPTPSSLPKTEISDKPVWINTQLMPLQNDPLFAGRQKNFIYLAPVGKDASQDVFHPPQIA